MNLGCEGFLCEDLPAALLCKSANDLLHVLEIRHPSLPGCGIGIAD